MTASVVEKAMRIAARAHEGQNRKEGNLPYISHPTMAALKLTKHGFRDEVIAAALVHDVLEDTDYPPEKMKGELGEDVFEMVLALSEDKSLPWRERKEKYIEAVRNASDEVKAVSAADKVHNLESLLMTYDEYGPKTWELVGHGKEEKIWFEESMLKMLHGTWDHPLVDEYEKLVEWMKGLE